MRKFNLQVGLDVDDVLFHCSEYAVKLANTYGNFDPPISINEVTGWGKTGKRTDILLDYYQMPEFFETQPVCPGAKEFIQQLLKMGVNLFLITAVEPQFMGIRIKRILSEFPEIKKENIIMGYRKDLVKMDIILDDGAHNCIASPSVYPVLLRKPWNQHMTGCYAVNNYDEFLVFVKTIQELRGPVKIKEGNKIFALVGPSGSGKTELLNRMVNRGVALRNVSCTTRIPRENEINGIHYHFITKEEFLRKEHEGILLESTRYAGECYGTSKEDLEMLLNDNNVIMAIDICGAISLKSMFPEQVVPVYIKRPKEALVGEILNRNCSNEDKKRRILALSDEEKNEELCMETIHNDGLIEDSEEELYRIIKMYSC